MPCYNPLIRIEDHKQPYKKLDGKTAYKAKVYPAEYITGHIEEIKRQSYFARWDIIPCGKCIGCRLDYSRDWANRGYLEAKSWKENYFVTITYDEIHMVKNDVLREKDGKTIRSYNGTLVKKDLQNFIKRVRTEKEREYEKKIKNEEEAKAPNIRFMACGEYGDENSRPHYHIIFFNLHLEPETFYNPKIKEGNIYWQNTFIEKCWKKGISNICEANWNTIAYVARYITKKITGKEAEKEYQKRQQEREYMVMSRMPGIGKLYYDQNKDKIYKRDEIIVKNSNGIISCKPPKYFDYIYEKEEPEKFKKIQEKRRIELEKSNKYKDLKTSLTRLEQYKIEEATKEQKGKMLKRGLTKDLDKVKK